MDSVILKKIMYVLIAVCVALVVTVIVLVLRPTPVVGDDELARNKERVRVLEELFDESQRTIKTKEAKQDSLVGAADKASSERDYYKKLYWYEKNRVASLPLDSGVVFLSGWISEGDSL